MEAQISTLSTKPIKDDYSSKVDTSRPFRSVKEAVAIFGERIVLGGDVYYSPKPYYTCLPGEDSSRRFSSSTPPILSPGDPNVRDKEQNYNNGFLDSLKKLEAELDETKAELKLLKERESETEIALASLNAELHKNMSKMAEAEAAAAANNKATSSSSSSIGREKKEHSLLREKERRRELMMSLEDSPTLAQILSLAEERVQFGIGSKQERKMMMMKKKPIVPLVADLFIRKKRSSHNNNNNNTNSLYASPQTFF